MSEIDSILQSTKKKCGLDPETNSDFDADIIDCINSALNVLTQNGVGPKEGFVIHGPEETWSDFLNDERLYMAKIYVFDRTRLIFDATGLSSYVIQMIQDRIKEYEWRLNVYVENTKTFGICQE